MTGRILCLGDSLTYGFGLPRGLVWTALCAAQTGAELLGWELDRLLGDTLEAMRAEEQAIEQAVAEAGAKDIDL